MIETPMMIDGQGFGGEGLGFIGIDPPDHSRRADLRWFARGEHDDRNVVRVVAIHVMQCEIPRLMPDLCTDAKFMHLPISDQSATPFDDQFDALSAGSPTPGGVIPAPLRAKDEEVLHMVEMVCVPHELFYHQAQLAKDISPRT